MRGAADAGPPEPSGGTAAGAGGGHADLPLPESPAAAAAATEGSHPARPRPFPPPRLFAPSGIDVLLNAESKRETPAMVSFNDKQRFLGVHAAGKVGRL
jgi:hypothetical protein